MSSSCAVGHACTSPRTRWKRPARSLQVGHAARCLRSSSTAPGGARPATQSARRAPAARNARHAVQVQRAHRPRPGSRLAGAGLRPARARAASLNWPCSALRAAHRRPGAHGSAAAWPVLGARRGPAGGGGSRRPAAGPRAKARRLASTPTPPRADGGFEGLAAEGQRRRCAASAPNSTALMTLPLRSAAAAMSKRMKRCAASGRRPAAARRCRHGRRPAPSSRRWHRRGGWRRSAWCGPASPGRAAWRGRPPSVRRRSACRRRPAAGISASTGAAPRLGRGRGNSST